ncbi:MAG: FeoB-associated Cys-rich membrane protein [bacterium]
MRSKYRILATAGVALGSFTLSTNLVTGSESAQPQDQEVAAKEDSLVGFFAVGMIINIALVAAYVIWAYKQWKRKKNE